MQAECHRASVRQSPESLCPVFQKSLPAARVLMQNKPPPGLRKAKCKSGREQRLQVIVGGSSKTVSGRRIVGLFFFILSQEEGR